MPDSPLALSPYAVLGVPEHSSEPELRRAYLRKLREAHPDTGGSTAQFDLVRRAWEQVGTPEARASYDSGADRGRDADDSPARTWAPRPPSPRASSRPQARMHGHPGGWFREQYLDLLAEWVGRGSTVPNPYDPALVRSAPVEIRHLLASAIAEEETAVVLAGLGIAFTVWNDVLTDKARGAWAKIDHIVLGPTGIWGVLSEDWGDVVSVRRGEVVGAGIARDEKPVQDLVGRARVFERQAKVKFSSLVIVVPDASSPDGVIPLGKVRGAQTLLLPRSRLANVVQTRPAGLAFGGTDLFEVRTRIQNAARFV
jgi:hypothetical protein